MSESKKSGLDLLKEPFPPHLISKLPKGTKAQNECQPSEKVNCNVCGGWHHPKIVHLDYVGHAAVTHRLLEADPGYNYEWVEVDEFGGPKLDRNGGAWLRLTVCGLTRLGYGDAQGKTGPNATKELLGDAIRNAAMRFGVALDLWSKADLHADSNPEPTKQVKKDKETKPVKTIEEYEKSLKDAFTADELQKAWLLVPNDVKKILVTVKDEVKQKLQE